MAHIWLNNNGVYYVRFRFGGVAYNRSLRTTNRREARAVRGRVEETLLMLERGRLELPQDADPAAFILSDGKRNEKPTRPVIRTLADLFRVYNDELPAGAKEEKTISPYTHPD